MGADNQSIVDGDNESNETQTHTTELTGTFIFLIMKLAQVNSKHVWILEVVITNTIKKKYKKIYAVF